MTDSPPKAKSPILERLEKLLKVSGSVYALLAGIAAVIIANQSDSHRTRFTIYMVSQSWIECGLLTLIWLLYKAFKRLLSGAHGYEFSRKTLFSPRTLAIVVAVSFALVMTGPPLVYIAKVRYQFWTQQILIAYYESAKLAIDNAVLSGEIDTAQSTIERVSDVLKGTALARRLDYRNRVLKAIIQRSHSLETSSMSQMNPVTQRQLFFSLVEAVRINPENASAADRLTQKLQLVRSYLDDDAKAICKTGGDTHAFSGKAVAMIEAQSLWQHYGTSDHCAEVIRDALFDGWGMSPIACNLARSANATRGRSSENSDAKGCPEGEDFWTPLESASENEADLPETSVFGGDHPVYPTVLDLWRSLKKHRKSGGKSSEDAASTP